RNTPVTILASGNVNIAGTINLDGGTGSASNVINGTDGGGLGGPGGFDGGRGGTTVAGFTNGFSGNGPGGGGGGGSDGSANVGGGGGGGSPAGTGTDGTQTGAGVAGKGGGRYGAATLVPLIGGSGGGGGGGTAQQAGYGGSGGGGAVFLCRSRTITVWPPGLSAFINARGASEGDNSCSGPHGGGDGAGGAVRIAAATISGELSINVAGGIGHCGGMPGGGNGAGGAVRIEAYNYTSFNPHVNGALLNELSSSPNPVGLPNAPQLQITSVAGIVAPANPGGSFYNPDILLPNNQSNPVSVILAASNIPLNTAVQVTMLPQVGAPTVVQSTPLSGTFASSTATAILNLPSGTSLITATAVVDLSQQSARVRPLFI